MSSDRYMKTAAKRLGIPLAVYLANRAAGLKWCSAGRHWTPLRGFGVDTNRSDGFDRDCKECRRKRWHASKERRAHA